MAKKIRKVSKKVARKATNDNVQLKITEPKWWEILKLKYQYSLLGTWTGKVLDAIAWGVCKMIRLLIRLLKAVKRGADKFSMVREDISVDDAEWKMFCAKAKKHGLTGEEFLAFLLKQHCAL